MDPNSQLDFFQKRLNPMRVVDDISAVSCLRPWSPAWGGILRVCCDGFAPNLCVDMTQVCVRFRAKLVMQAFMMQEFILTVSARCWRVTLTRQTCGRSLVGSHI